MEQLELLLHQFLVPDNEARKNAEDQIRLLSKDAQLVPALLHQIRTARSANVRQLAAVLMRKKVMGHWMKLSPQQQSSLKSSLLESMTLDSSIPVRHSCANVVSVLAKHEVPANQWPDLFPFLLQCSQSSQEDHREVALVLFTSLTETIGDVLRPHFPTLQSIFSSGLKDNGENVRVAALKAVGAFVGYIQTEQEILMFRDLIAPILDVSRYCLEVGSEDVAILAFEIFDELVESPAPLLGPAVPVIIQFALEVSSNKSFESNTRCRAIQVISWLCKHKPKTVVKHKVVPAIIGSMCQILSEPDTREDEFDTSPDRAAAEVLDNMAINLPKKHVFPHVFSFSVSNFQSPDYNIREAAIMSLGVISEGCYEVMKNALNDILNLVLQAFNDPETAVRGAASFTIGQFAEHLQPDIIEHYERVLPCIFTVLGDSSPIVQEKAYYALSAFCEHLGQEILPFLPALMERLFETLHVTRRDLQETCMSAIGSAAAAAESAFTPYASRILEAMQKFMVLTKDEDLSVRARATELVGIVGIAVGREYIEPHLSAYMEAAISGFSLDYSELREYTHGFFSSVAEILGQDIAQYLPRLVPLALATCNLDDGTALEFEDSDEEGAGLYVSSDDESDDGKNVRNISVRTGILDEKAAATQALGLFALHAKAAFVPYLETTLKVLRKNCAYFHEDVRLQAVIALQHMFTATQAAFPNAERISGEAKHVLDNVMELYLRTMKEDEDKDTVSQVCTCIADIFKSQDALTMEPYIVPLSEAVLKLLRQDAICQQTDDAESEDDTELEHDQMLMEAVVDVLPAMSTCFGPAFEPIFREHFETLMKFSKASRPASERTMVVACFAEVARDIGLSIAPYVPRVVPVALKDLSAAESTNRRNAAFCLGEMCRSGGEKATEYYSSILTALYPLFGETEPDAAVRDNAAGAVARMVMTQPQALPLAQVLPTFIKALPVQEDFEESKPVYECLSSLIQATHPEILPHVPQVLNIFAKVSASEHESDEVKACIGRAVSHLLTHYRSEMQPLLSSIPAQEANALASIVARI